MKYDKCLACGSRWWRDVDTAMTCLEVQSIGLGDKQEAGLRKERYHLYLAVSSLKHYIDKGKFY